MSSTTYKKATFWERLGAHIIDALILIPIFITLSFLFKMMSFNIWITEALLFSLRILYHAVFLWKFAATPGKKLLHVKVVTDHYTSIGFGQALFRESIGKLLSTIFSLGYLWILINKKKQAWHDSMAKTYVVKTNTQGKYIPIKTDEAISLGQKILFGFFLCIAVIPILFFGAVIVLFKNAVQPIQIVGNAMEPTYVNGQQYFVDKRAYIHNQPARGDVILFKIIGHPDLGKNINNVEYIKRVIAIPGDTVSIKKGEVLVNKQQVNKIPYVGNSNMQTVPGTFLPEGEEKIVPNDQYFVLGDNRRLSADSREWGFIPKANIIGKIGSCYYKCELSKPNSL